MPSQALISFFGLFPSMAIALIEFTKEVNYAIVHNKIDHPIFLLPKQLVTDHDI